MNHPLPQPVLPEVRRVVTPAQRVRTLCAAVEAAAGSVRGVASARAIRLLTTPTAPAGPATPPVATDRMRVDVVITGLVPIPQLEGRIRERVAEAWPGTLDLHFVDVADIAAPAADGAPNPPGSSDVAQSAGVAR